MCVIVDANLASKVFSRTLADPEFKPVLRWLYHGEGILVYGGHNEKELRIIGDAAAAITELHRSGKAVPFGSAELAPQEAYLRKQGIKSNDPHVLALARVSRARTLVSHDKPLHDDFKNLALVPSPRGMIYQNSSHQKCLKHTEGCCKKKHNK
jgi:predicted nucleic acid-binding protein